MQSERKTHKIHLAVIWVGCWDPIFLTTFLLNFLLSGMPQSVTTSVH